MKNEKGITLVALVITIIVLLILAIVSVKILTDSSIIGHANNAVTAYGAAQEAEETSISNAESKMDDYASKIGGGSNSSSGTYYTITFKSAEELAALDWDSIIGKSGTEYVAVVQDTAGESYVVTASYDTNELFYMMTTMPFERGGERAFHTNTNTWDEDGSIPTISGKVKILTREEITEMIGEDPGSLLTFSQLGSLVNLTEVQ